MSPRISLRVGPINETGSPQASPRAKLARLDASRAAPGACIPFPNNSTASAGARPVSRLGLVTRAWHLANAVAHALETTVDNKLYADSAQARAMDKSLAGGHDDPWCADMSPQEAAANNRAWLEILHVQEAARLASSKQVIALALGKMEAMCGSGAAARRTQ